MQDFLFPAYPSQKDFEATQTKLQVTLNHNSDLKRVSTFFSQLQYFKARYRNEIINEAKAAQLLSKFFDEDFRKIKGVLKDFSISKQLLSTKASKTYAAPGSDSLTSNTYSHLINFLSYGYKPHTVTAPNPYQNTMSIDGYTTYGNTIQRFREIPNGANYATNYSSLRDELFRGPSKRSVASVGYNQQRNPIASLNHAGKIDIEKRIHLDNLKRHLSNKFEQEKRVVMQNGYPGDLRSQMLGNNSKFGANLSMKTKRRFQHPSSALHHRRTTNPHRANKLMRINNNEYNSANNDRVKLPSTGNNLISNKSGSLHPSKKMNKRQKKDKASYEYFLSIANQSLAKGRKEQTPYYTQPDTINREIGDVNSESQYHNLEDPQLNQEQIEGFNVDDGHTDNTAPDYRQQEGKRSYSQQKTGPRFKKSSKNSIFNEGQYSKYTSLREEKGLSVKPRNAEDDRSSTRSNVMKRRNKPVMNNGDKIKNIYKMTPSRPIFTKCIRDRNY